MMLCTNFLYRPSVRTVLKTIRYNLESSSCSIQTKKPSYLLWKQELFFNSSSCPFRNRLYVHRSYNSMSLKRCLLNNTDSTTRTSHSLNFDSNLIRFCSTAPSGPQEKLSLVQRFKKMYKEYWYVLVPVHIITSAFWFSSFYYLSKSGVDIASLLERVGAGESLVEKLRSGNSKMGYIAVSYALYKIATPIRYTVTLGGTTISIKYLKDWGYIKPIPPKDKLKEIIHEKKGKLNEKKENLKELYINKSFTHKFLIKLGIKKDCPSKKTEN